MSSVRRLLGIVVLALLTLGYLASQAAYLFGDPVAYASRVDIPQVKYLSLVLFLAAIVLALIPEKEEQA